jgi:hypothetical protein
MRVAVEASSAAPREQQALMDYFTTAATSLINRFEKERGTVSE